ncbi:Protein shuttle craft, partial [Frankliniella fusca]
YPYYLPAGLAPQPAPAAPPQPVAQPPTIDDITRVLSAMSLAAASVNAVASPPAGDGHRQDRDGRDDRRRAPNPDRRWDGRREGGRGDYARDRTRDHSFDRQCDELSRLYWERDRLAKELSRRDWDDRVRGADNPNLPYPPRDRRDHYAPRGPPAYDDRRHYTNHGYQDSGGRGRPSRRDPRRENPNRVESDFGDPEIEDHDAAVLPKN